MTSQWLKFPHHLILQLLEWNYVLMTFKPSIILIQHWKEKTKYKTRNTWKLAHNVFIALAIESLLDLTEIRPCPYFLYTYALLKSLKTAWGKVQHLIFTMSCTLFSSKCKSDISILHSLLKQHQSGVILSFESPQRGSKTWFKTKEEITHSSFWWIKTGILAQVLKIKDIFLYFPVMNQR